ncbi:MAG: hypothetical protein R3F43_23830 [bacterium]
MGVDRIGEAEALRPLGTAVCSWPASRWAGALVTGFVVGGALADVAEAGVLAAPDRRGRAGPAGPPPSEAVHAGLTIAALLAPVTVAWLAAVAWRTRPLDAQAVVGWADPGRHARRLYRSPPAAGLIRALGPPRPGSRAPPGGGDLHPPQPGLPGSSS